MLPRLALALAAPVLTLLAPATAAQRAHPASGFDTRGVAVFRDGHQAMREAFAELVSHEVGHALVRIALPGSETVHKVSIIPRSVGSLGYTLQRPTEDKFLITMADLGDHDGDPGDHDGRSG